MKTATLAILCALAFSVTSYADCPNGRCVVKDVAGRIAGTVQQTGSASRYVVKSSAGRIVQTIQVRGNQAIVRPVGRPKR